MVMFHIYVSLPEGIISIICDCIRYPVVIGFTTLSSKHMSDSTSIVSYYYYISTQIDHFKHY